MKSETMSIYDEVRQRLLSFRGSDKHWLNQLGMDEFLTIFSALRDHLENLSAATADDLYGVTRVGKFFGRQFPAAGATFRSWIEEEKVKIAGTSLENSTRAAVLEYFQLGLEFGQKGSEESAPTGELYEVIFPRMEQGTVMGRSSTGASNS